MKGFKQFILRGNVLDLAVAVVMGGAFGAVVTALVKDIITPATTLGSGNAKNIDFSAIKLGPFLIGDFINAVVSFIVLAAAVYFFIVLPVNALINRMKRQEIPADPTTKKCPECLSDIPVQARRCAFCTAIVGERVTAA
jgi:large conductance mechanosensitive channel